MIYSNDNDNDNDVYTKHHDHHELGAYELGDIDHE